MKAYKCLNREDAVFLRHIIQLSDGCIRLKWNKNIQTIPDSVYDALDTILDYVQSSIIELCGESVADLNEEKENAIIQIVNQTPKIKSNLGIGTVLAGEEAGIVLNTIKNEALLNELVLILKSGYSLVLY